MMRSSTSSPVTTVAFFSMRLSWLFTRWSSDFSNIVLGMAGEALPSSTAVQISSPSAVKAHTWLESRKS
ncbi:hypothetical protein D3C78_1706510 [compost metagenome]